MKTSVIIYIIAAVAHSVILASGTPVPVIPRDVSTSLDKRAVASDYEVLPRNFLGSNANDRVPATLEGQSGSRLQLVRRGISGPKPLPPVEEETKKQLRFFFFAFTQKKPASLPHIQEVSSAVACLVKVHDAYVKAETTPNATAGLGHHYVGLRSNIVPILINLFDSNSNTVIDLIINIGNNICLKRYQNSMAKTDYDFAKPVLEAMATMMKNLGSKVPLNLEQAHYNLKVVVDKFQENHNARGTNAGTKARL